MRFIAYAAAVSAAVAAAPAGATSATRTLDFQGFEAGSRNVYADYSVGGATGSVAAAAGGFDMRDTGSLERFVAWCIDVATFLRDPHEYHEAPVLDSAQLTDVQKVFEANYAAPGEADSPLGGAVTSAAFQLAVWDALYDDDWDVDGRGAGDDWFEVTSAASGVESQAQIYLDAAKDHDLSNGTVWVLGQLHGGAAQPASQSLVTATPHTGTPIGVVATVPAPAGALLLASAFGLAAWRGRARRG